MGAAPAPIPVPLPAAPAAPGALRWPLPHHFRVVHPGGSAGPEHALLTFNDGRRVQGTVVELDLESDPGTFRFRPDNAQVREVGMGEFRSLYLTRSVELEPIGLAVPPGATEGRPSMEKRRCLVEFKDGTTLETDTVATIQRRAGLFLYVPNYAEAVLRWFIPAQAVTRSRIGEALGEALVERRLLGKSELEAGLAEQERLRGTRVGEYLAGQSLVTREQVEAALDRQRSMPRVRLGDTLVQLDLVTPEQRDAALALQAADRGKLLGEVLVEMGLVTPEVVRRVLVEQLGVPAVDLARFPFDPNAVKAVSPDLAFRHRAMPLYRTDTRIAVAIENPLSWEALQELEFYTGMKVDPVLAPREAILGAIAQLYDRGAAGEGIRELVSQLGGAASPQPELERVVESDSVLVRLVNKMIVDAYQRGASDIHIESMTNDKPSRVRFRIDGALSYYIDIPANFRSAMVSRIKIMADLDISERRRPQDGKIAFDEAGIRHLELRVVTMPTANGLEDVVMRILAAPRALTVDQLGLSPRALAEVKAMAQRTFGLFFVCGPTGSGKTTTLHSVLAHINTPDRKIWTVEDPIEIAQDGLCQVQVNARIGLTFPEVLRGFMRADPDVIMVGETRDAETARTVVAASLTGHLVLSTMHTNSAAESVVRLLDLGLDPFNFSDALLGILAQRLARRLCPDCRAPHDASAGEIEALAREYCEGTKLQPDEIAARWRSRYAGQDGELTLHSAVGCGKCDGTGYKGRIGVHELLVATPAIKARIQEGATTAHVLEDATAAGMTTLLQDGLEKVLQGHTDVKHVRAACL